MEFQLSKSQLRPWQFDDAEPLARHLNSHDVWINMHGFPYPYTLDDALNHIGGRLARPEEPQWAVEVAGELGCGIWLQRGEGVYENSAEIGYWLAKAHQGRGVATEADEFVTGYGFDELKLARIYALVFEWNAASIGVLERAGHELEARHHKAVTKDGKTIDHLMCALVRETD